MCGSPWLIGGHRLSGESTRAGAVRHFLHDTGMLLTPNRLQFIGVYEYLFHDREQAPQDTPCHSQCTTFALALTNEEQAAMKVMVNHEEYSSDPPQLYDLVKLEQQKLHPVLGKLWRKIFE